MDETVFERWKESRKRRGKARIGVIGKVIIGIGAFIALASSFGIVFAAAPSKLIATVQGHVVESERDWDDEDIDPEAKEYLRRHVTVKLDTGGKAGVDLPRGEEVRVDAHVKLDVYRKAFGPLQMEFHKFAGYVDAAK